jgi:4a-hydroxytetrahydrobiopterin dehydratase
VTTLTKDVIRTHLHQDCPQWHHDEKANLIRRDFHFKDFHQTMAFVNALAWLAHQSNHHPDLEVGYNYCHVKYSTHDAGGITLKDIECAKGVDQLL